MEGLSAKDADHTWTFGVTTLKIPASGTLRIHPPVYSKGTKAEERVRKGKGKNKENKQYNELIETKIRVIPVLP